MHRSQCYSLASLPDRGLIVGLRPPLVRRAEHGFIKARQRQRRGATL